MAEGKRLSWRGQEIDIRPTPDYRELAMPLKAPPRGFKWQRLEDGAWELRITTKVSSLLEQKYEDRKEQEEEEEQAEEKQRAPAFLEHVVMPDDTLAGICLKYKVKDRELRRLNGFVGSHFRMCDVLIIPNRFAAGQQPIQGSEGEKPMARQEMMQIFRRTSELGPQEARFYLETNDWDLTEALAEWREENEWEMEQAEIQESALEGDVLNEPESATVPPPRSGGFYGSQPGPTARLLHGSQKVKIQ